MTENCRVNNCQQRILAGEITRLRKENSELAARVLSCNAQCALSREQIAQAIYETEPFYEGGEYVDGFQVSPGGNLSWKQACARDAEFADDKIMLPITKFAYDAADRVLALSAVTSTDGGQS